MSKDGIKQSLIEEMSDMDVVDTHEHLPNEAERLKQQVDFSTLFSHYCRSDLVAAGMADADYDRFVAPGLSPSEKWELLAPYYELIISGSYTRAAHLSMEHFYGMSRLATAADAEALSKRIQEANEPGLYRRVLKDTCRIATALNFSGMGVDRDFFTPVLFVTPYRGVPELICGRMRAVRGPLTKHTSFLPCSTAPRDVSVTTDSANVSLPAWQRNPGRGLLVECEERQRHRRTHLSLVGLGELRLVLPSGRFREACMGRVEEAVRAEIMRLVRRELRSVVLPLGRDVRQLKRGLGRVSKSVARLERVVAAQVREAEARKARLEVPEEEAKRARLSANLIRKLRTRLAITQGQLAVLVGVSAGAVAQWEHGVVSPRGQNRAALVALRKLGRREVRRMLEQKGMAVPSKGRSRRARGG